MKNQEKPPMILTIAGKDDSTTLIENVLKIGLGKYFPFESHIVPHQDNGETLEQKYSRLKSRVVELSHSHTVIPMGLSAGASHALLLLADKEIEGLIPCAIGVGRYRVGDEKGFRSIESRSKGAKTFGQAVRKTDAMINDDLIDPQRLLKFLALISPWDQLVRSSDGQVKGAINEKIIFPEHVTSIALACAWPKYVKLIVSHIEKNI